MKPWQKAVKYAAMALAVCLIVSIIGGILSCGGSVSCGGNVTCGGEDVVGEKKEYTIESKPTSLEIEIKAARLTIQSGDEFYVESNYKYLTVEEKANVLCIGDTKKSVGAIRGNPMVTLYVPTGTVFDDVALTTAAGTVEVETFAAKTVAMKFGAGDVLLKNITVEDYISIEGGAGELSIENGNMHSLELKMGVGELRLRSKLTGSSVLNMGVGESNVTLLGSSKDYSVRIEKGIGEAKIEGITAVDGMIFGTGASKVKIDGGIGSIQVRFD